MINIIRNEALINKNDLLEARLKEIPTEPGCYLFKDSQDNLLYVGKSKSLRSRVRSYFRTNNSHSPRIRLMIMQIADIQIIITDSDSEALVLESNLIKNQQPYFNVLLKDDKKYPYLCITWSDEYPRLFITRMRNSKNLKDKFYGPYVDVSLLRQTLMLVKKLFPLRQRPRPLYANRACLNYSIGRCPGVCQKKISSEEYHKIVQRVSMIFQGRSEELTSLLYQQMRNYSENYDYESAAYVRDQIRGIDQLTQSQKMIIPGKTLSRDIIALASNDKLAAIQIFQMRSGKLVGRLAYTSEIGNKSSQEILQIVLEQHYSNVEPVEIPNEILVQYQLPKENLISVWLSDIKGRKVNISYPKRKEKLEIIDLVVKNANFELTRSVKAKEYQTIALEDLTQLLELSNIPRRIECYDISHIQGAHAVASQIVFIQGLPAKQHYRKYNIKSSSITPGHSDDFMSMAEIVRRRFRKWSLAKLEGVDISTLKQRSDDPLNIDGLNDWPDLIVIDGGKGQLNAVMEALRKLKLEEEITVCSLAKRNEEVFVPGSSEPLETEASQPALILLRKLRDEAHRFAVNFHRQKRSIAMKRSRLSEIPGLGVKRRKELLAHFRSVEAIQLATFEELVALNGFGKSTARQVWSYFHPEVDIN